MTWSSRAAETPTGRGGVGKFLPACRHGGFGLKVVRLKTADGEVNPNFWNEAQSLHTYCSAARFLGQSLKVPVAAQFFIAKTELRKYCRETPSPVPECTALGELFRETCGTERLRDYGNYVPVPEALLRKIYVEEQPADLLMCYPVADGGERNLTAYFDEAFSAADAESMVRQIAAAILELYRSGRAHGDIKPQNIMVSELNGKKCFRLTDFGSTHASGRPSNTGTENFFDGRLYQNILDKTGDELKARVCTDCHALVHTLYALAVGRLPGTKLIDPWNVTERWPELEDLWRELRPVNEASIEKLERIAADTPVPITPDWQPVEFFRNIGFDPLWPEEDDKTEYGRFHEEIRFSEEFDPMMRIYGIRFDNAVFRLFPEFYHIPLATNGIKTWLIFHAPDDAKTGKRPKEFGKNYVPKSLANTDPTPEDCEKLLEYGRRLDRYFDRHPVAAAWLPEKKHIIWCDGKMKLLWGAGKKVAPHRVSFANYFRWLVAGEADFSMEELVYLLPHLPELDPYIDPRTAWRIFLSTPQLCRELREKHPELMRRMGEEPPRKLAVPDRFDAFMKYGKCDRENFLRWFPANARRRFTPAQWGLLLCADPELLSCMPEKLLPKLNRETWVRLLGRYPDLADRCPMLDAFSPREWTSILLCSPELKDRCPTDIVFAEKDRKRLRKKVF